MGQRRLLPFPSLCASLGAWAGYLFLVAPSLIVVPISFGGDNSFLFPPRRFSLDLFREYIFGSSWMSVTLQSFVVGLGSMAAAVTLGVGAAYGLDRSDFPGKRLLILFLLSPVFVPAIVLALGLYLYLAHLRLAGTTLGLILCHTIVTMPFVIISTTGGLRHIDRNLETAAMVMGASRSVVLRKVTLPLLLPSLIAGALFAFLISFDEVVISYFVSGVRTETLPVKMFSSIRWEVSPVLAAISTLMTGLSLAICLVVAHLRRTDLE